jgi:hypothetical protein
MKHVAPEFGPYRLLRRIASGGMGEVYLAVLEKGDFRKQLAVKRILPGCDGREEFIHCFSREAALLGLLNHANIVQVFDYGCLDGQFYLAMELVEGPDLAALLQAGGKLHPALAAEVVLQLCRALGHAHERPLPDGRAGGVVHGDVSPQNVLLTCEGQVKLADFGVARMLRAAGADELTGGKALYMSPEQARGEPPCAYSDLYSLGLVAWEMLCAERPRSGDLGQMLLEARQGKMPALDRLSAVQPAAWREFLEKALQPRPEDRFASAVEMGRFVTDNLAPAGPEALGAEVAARLPALADSRSSPEPTMAAAVPVAWLAEKPARRWRWLLAGGLLLLAAGAGWWWHKLERLPARESLWPQGAELTPQELFAPGYTPAAPSEIKPEDSPLEAPRQKPQLIRRLRRQAPPSEPAALPGGPEGSLAISGAWRMLQDGRSVDRESLLLPPGRAQILQLVHLNRPAQVTLRLVPHHEGWQLSVNAQPWLQIELDEQPLGQTPRVGLAVPPGRHRLKLFRADENLQAELRFDLP